MTKKINIYDGFSLLFIVLFLFVVNIPQPTCYVVLEACVWARIFLMMGLGLCVFFQGMKEDRTPIILDLLLTVISLAYLFSVWSDMVSYTHIESMVDLSWSQTLYFIILFLGGTGAFYGFGSLFRKAIEESEG